MNVDCHNTKKMKYLVIMFCLFLLLIFFSGCPYDSDIALEKNPSTEIDSLILGKWYSDNIKGEDCKQEYQIFQFNKFEYYLELKVLCPKDTEIYRYRGFITTFESMQLLNLENIERDRSFNFFRIIKKKDKLKVAWVSDEYVKQKFTNEIELKEYFKDNMYKKGFFDEKNEFILKRE